MDLNYLLALSLERKYDFLVRHLKELKSKNFFRVNPSDLECFISEPRAHSLLFIYLLDNVPWAIVQKPFYHFLVNFDEEQIFHSMKRFNDVVEEFVKFAIENNFGVKIIKPLYFAVKKLEAYGITPLHNLYLQVCLRLKMYKEAFKLASKPVGYLTKKTGGIFKFELCSDVFSRNNSIRRAHLFLLLRSCVHWIKSFFFSFSLNYSII